MFTRIIGQLGLPLYMGGKLDTPYKIGQRIDRNTEEGVKSIMPKMPEIIAEGYIYKLGRLGSYLKHGALRPVYENKNINITVEELKCSQGS